MVLKSAKSSHRWFIGCQMIFRITLLATCLSIFPITGEAADNLGILGAPPEMGGFGKVSGNNHS